MGPIVKVQNSKNWHVEARYNYEARKTVSFYVGKEYSGTSPFFYSFTPIIGGVTGEFRGGSAGFNLDLEYKKFYISSQSQYTFSADYEIENFFFSWSEIGYQPLKWLYGGVAMQPTYYPFSRNSEMVPGGVIGFTFGKWTIPVYVFNPLSDNTMVVCSIIKTWGK
jgi:hypothetical protein